MEIIETERFVNKISDDFICPICKNFLSYPNIQEDPVGHLFCNTCIETWLIMKKECPLDRTHLDESKMRPIGVVLKSMLSNLQVNCKYKRIGCKEICKLEMLMNHEKDCIYSKELNYKISQLNGVYLRKPVVGHLMISYNRDSRDLCLRIKSELEKSDYKIWIDVDNIHGSSLESMANAIEQSSCVLMCMTEKYKNSQACQTEAEYAYSKKVPILPLIMQKNYEPDGWLGIILGSKIYVNFTRYPFDDCMRRLKSELNFLMKQEAVIGSSPANPNLQKQSTATLDRKRKAKMQTIGMHKINYEYDLNEDVDYASNISINTNGYVLVECNELFENSSVLLLFDSSDDGTLIRKAYYNHRITSAISNESIYLVTHDDECKSFELQAFDFEMNLIKSYQDSVLYTIVGFYTIDVCSDRIYLKVQVDSPINDFYYHVYVFDAELNKTETFTFNDSNDLNGLRIRNGLLAYYRNDEDDNTYLFTVKSIDSQNVLNRFLLKSKSAVFYDIGPNGNLFVINNKQSTLNEYDLNGTLIKCTRLNFDLSSSQRGACHLRIADNFDFALNDSAMSTIYLN